MNILFHTNQISERGTEVALFDYASGNKNILKGASFIAAPKNRVFENSILEKFKADFDVLLYEELEEIDSFIEKKNIDLTYQISHGKKENLITNKVPVFVHCVFTTKERFGAFYCPISEYLNRYYRTKYPVLHHIVKAFPGTKRTLHRELNIPKNVTIFGSYGGKNALNIQFVQETILEIAKQRSDIFFLFMNFIPWTNGLSNIIFLPGNTNPAYKEMFINTCDAMIHGRADGETFGLSIAEFSIKNKPVITWNPNCIHNFYFCLKSLVHYVRKQGHIYAKAHLDFLGDKAISYSNKKNLTDILVNFKAKYLKSVNYDCYSERFSEEKIMRIFEGIIKGCL
jgi:glycosyltransferase involved in cell wall biosynthesis